MKTEPISKISRKHMAFKTIKKEIGETVPKIEFIALMVSWTTRNKVSENETINNQHLRENLKPLGLTSSKDLVTLEFIKLPDKKGKSAGERN